MNLTEIIQLKKTKELSGLCHKSKNLYNFANYLIRQRFIKSYIKENSWIRYYELWCLLKYEDVFRELPYHTSQLILKQLDKTWKSFFKAIKDWKIHPEKYQGRPKLLKYKKKDGEFMLIFDYTQCKIKDGRLYFPRQVINHKKSEPVLLPIKTRIKEKPKFIRILPRGSHYICEIIYEKKIRSLNLDKKRIIGIDLGVNNLVSIVNNVGLRPFIIKGGIVKSINQFYNKRRSELHSIKDKQGYKFQTKRLKRLDLKRSNMIRDFFHKTSRKAIDYCIKNNFGTIMIGYNSGWKQKVDIGKRNNQKFVGIPFLKLINQIKYKSELIGIDLVLHNENHTSKCSFLDNEEIRHHKKYMGKRIKRGIFKSKNGILINADINGAYNIIKKAIPNAFKVDGIEVLELKPFSVSVFSEIEKNKLTCEV